MIEIEVEIEGLLKEEFGYNFRDVTVKAPYGNYTEDVLGSTESPTKTIQNAMDSIYTPAVDHSLLDLSSRITINSIYAMYPNQYIKLNKRKIVCRLGVSYPVMCFSIFLTDSIYNIRYTHAYEDILSFLRDPTLHVINVPKTLEYQKNGFLE